MHSRHHPYLARIKERTRLTGPTSSRRTYHIVLDIENSPLSFRPGDSIGILPTNQLTTVETIIRHFQATGDEEICDPRSHLTMSFRHFLQHNANIHKLTPSLLKLLGVTHPAHSLADISHGCIHPTELCRHLLPLLPRFYSIASSPLVFPNEIHLTVAHVEYKINCTMYTGVGSHFLCEQAAIGTTPIPIYVQPSSHFSLPAPSAPIILIGPGTGIAPFRAFLQERLATQASGLNWLFFGERNRTTDFYYGDFWQELEKQGRLRIDLAFSRDQSEKIYVQHKILENKKSIWQWIQDNCYIYVCGNAEAMATDVETAFLQIFREEGKLLDEEARKFMKTLRQTKRYLLDVY